MSDVIEVVDLETKKTREVSGKLKAEEVKQEFHNKEFDSMEHTKKVTENDVEVTPATAKSVTKTNSKKWSLFHKDKEINSPQYRREKAAKSNVQVEENYAELKTKHIVGDEEVEIGHYKKVDTPKVDEQINILKNTVNAWEKDLGASCKHLQSAITMLEGLKGYSNIIVQKKDSDRNLLHHVNIISAMMSHICASLSNAVRVATDIVTNNVMADTTLEYWEKDIKGIIGTYELASTRVTAEVNKAKKQSEDGNDITWYDIITSSMEKRMIDVSGVKKEDILGNAMSKVVRIKDGDERIYLKRDEKIQTYDDLVINGIHNIENKDLQRLFKSHSKEILAIIHGSSRKESSVKDKFIELTLLLSNEFKKINDAAKKMDNDTLNYKMYEMLENFVNYVINNGNSIMYYASNMKIDREEELTGRNIAVTVAANLFGISDLVVANEKVMMKAGKEEMSGFSMSEAKGTDYEHIDKVDMDDRSTYTGEFQRQMVMLQVFDAIMNQTDRHLNNIFFQTQEKDGKTYFVRATGIDNDTCAGLDTDLTVNKLHGLACIDKKGEFTIPVMDSVMYDYMLSLYGKDGNCEVLKDSMKGLIGDKYIEAMAIRFDMIMKAIDKTKKRIEGEGGKFMYEPSEWGEDTFDKLWTDDKFELLSENLQMVEFNNSKTYFEKFVKARICDLKASLS